MHWFSRKALLFMSIFAALLFATLVLPYVSSWLRDTSTHPLTLAQVRQAVDVSRSRAVMNLEARQAEIRKASAEKLRSELARSEALLAGAKAQQEEPRGIFDGVRPGKILQRKQLELSIAYREQEVAALNAALSAKGLEDALAKARQRMQQYQQVPTVRLIELAEQGCLAAHARLAEFRKKSRLERDFRNLWREEAALASRAKALCDDAINLRDRRALGVQTRDEYLQAKLAFAKAQEWTVGTVEVGTKDLEQDTLSKLLRTALVAFLLVLLAPYLVRTFFYFVLAPIAERSGAVQITSQNVVGTAAPPSAVSVSLRLEEDEELLVRQGFLQSTSREGKKATQWFLDWRKPLSSFASGLLFLTRIRGTGESTTVSAVQDPFAEVTTLVLPAGAAFVLHPRALAAVAQPIGSPLRITSHWRLGTLKAWLTLQLRYLVFHGPAKLVIKGTRGVRIEAAERGRTFSQAQLVGFTPSLAYAVSRTETFWPYFLGREALLKDTVGEGRGLIAIEEAPLAGKASGSRRGLEGAFDTLLKAFGL